MEESTDVVIRTRQDADLPDLADLLTRVYRQDGYPVEGVANPAAWLTFEQPPLGVWVAELNGVIVGHVALTHAAENDDAAQIWIARKPGSDLESIAVLCRLFVGPEARGRHLGRQLTVAATRRAHSLGRRTVLDVMAKDRAAMRTYEGLGWQRLASIAHKFGDGHRTEQAFAYVSPEALPQGA